MKLSILVILFSLTSFAATFTKAPKTVLIQESISNKLSIELPEVDLNNYVWVCNKVTKDFYCHTKETSTTNVMPTLKLGNSTYKISKVLPSGNIYKEDLSGQAPTWGQLSDITFFLRELETESEASIRIRAYGYVTKTMGDLQGRLLESH